LSQCGHFANKGGAGGISQFFAILCRRPLWTAPSYLSTKISKFPFRASIGENVDVRDLTWEQKEKVLRLLFARMNLEKEENNAKAPSPPKTSEPVLSIDNKPHV